MTRGKFTHRSIALTIAVTSFLAPTLTVISEPSAIAATDNTTTARKIWSGWLPYYSTKSALASALSCPNMTSTVLPFWFTLKSENRIANLYVPPTVNPTPTTSATPAPTNLGGTVNTTNSTSATGANLVATSRASAFATTATPSASASASASASPASSPSQSASSTPVANPSSSASPLSTPKPSASPTASNPANQVTPSPSTSPSPSSTPVPSTTPQPLPQPTYPTQASPIPTPPPAPLTPACDSVSRANQTLNLVDPVQQLHDYGYTVLPTITDGTATDPATGKARSMTLSTLLSKPATETKIVNMIAQLVESKKFDGIDLDFEDFAFIDSNKTWPTTAPRWIAFIKDLSAKLHANGKLLSVTTPPLFDPATGKKGYYVYSWAAIGSYIDQLRIMAYDYSTSSVGPIGPITWTEQAVQYAAAVMPASKVWIGVPGYGRDWVTAVNGTCPTSPINYQKSVAVGAKAATFLSRDALGLAASYGASPTFNPKFGESTFTYLKNYVGKNSAGVQTSCTATRTAWYQDAYSIGLRAGLVAKYHLGGLTEWTLGMEDNATLNAVMGVAQSIAPDPVIATLEITRAVNSSSAPTTPSAPSTSTPSATANYFAGDTVTVTGTLTKKDKSALPNVSGTIQYKVGSGPWQTIVAAQTDAQGKIAADLSLSGKVTFRFTTTGSWNVAPGQSQDLVITPSRLLSWSAPTSMKVGTTYIVGGTVQPAVAGVKVKLMRGAKSVDSTLTAADGSFSFTLEEEKVGVVHYQAIIDGDALFAASSGTSFGTLLR